MRISGFMMVRNGAKLYYPVCEAIESILPLVDEFVVALGDCDADDWTEKEISSIPSNKIKIIHTTWDLKKFPSGMENAHQTDIAKAACTGDWLFYLQADEVVHEKDLPVIHKRCEQLLQDKTVEGLLFNYYHFWGDYAHCHQSHGWYRQEIRIVRNDKDIHSWQSAQSFRRIPHFNGVSYRQKKNTFKLNVAKVDAHIYHYGFARPPRYMQKKVKALATIHKGESLVHEVFRDRPAEFDYGPLGRIPLFKGTHPEVMQQRIAEFHWGDELNYTKQFTLIREKHKHELLKNRTLSFIENSLLGGRHLFAPKNYILLDT